MVVCGITIDGCVELEVVVDEPDICDDDNNDEDDDGGNKLDIVSKLVEEYNEL